MAGCTKYFQTMLTISKNRQQELERVAAALMSCI